MRKARPFRGPDSKGRTTEGTLGRFSSTVANRARCSDGGGVLINFIKLAAVVYSTYRATTIPFEFLSLELRVNKTEKPI